MADPQRLRIDQPLFRVCTGWLAAMAMGVVVGGLLLVLFPSSAPIRWGVNRLIDPGFFPPGSNLSLLEPYREWLFAVLGACMAGWGGLMGFVVLGPFRRGEPWAWTALASTLLLWFFLDTSLSVAHGVSYNVVLNVILLSGFAVPLIASRRLVLRPSRTEHLERSLTGREP